VEKGMEMLRRLLLVVGGSIATLGFAYAAFVTVNGDTSGVVGMIAAAVGFAAWRAAVNWIFLYKPPLHPPAEQ
jgi:hypothetical protein